MTDEELRQLIASSTLLTNEKDTEGFILPLEISQQLLKQIQDSRGIFVWAHRTDFLPRAMQKQPVDIDG